MSLTGLITVESSKRLFGWEFDIYVEIGIRETVIDSNNTGCNLSRAALLVVSF
jgi:hypothetical protein